jgi:hypothetical protein
MCHASGVWWMYPTKIIYIQLVYECCHMTCLFVYSSWWSFIHWFFSCRFDLLLQKIFAVICPTRILRKYSKLLQGMFLVACKHPFSIFHSIPWILEIGKHFMSVAITSRKKKAVYVHGNHVEIRCRPWQSRLEKRKHFTSTAITWRLDAEIERLNHVQGNHVHAFYIHNIHGWSKFFASLNVTTWI